MGTTVRGSGLLTTSATRVSTFSATFHIIIVDAARSFLHTGFQLSKPIADTKAEIPARIFTRTFRDKVNSFRVIIVSSLFLYDIATINIQIKTFFFQERTAQPQAIIIISRTSSLQTDTRCTSPSVQAQTDFSR